jgi:hypothetical protein
MIRWLELMHQLAGSLEHSHAVLATATPLKLNQCTAQQRELCRELRALAHGIPDMSQARTLPVLAKDLQEATRRVAGLNRKYAALLQRSRRTVDIFCRVLASSGTTYPGPKPLSYTDGEETRPGE